jgi:hypothetical protein
VAPDEERALCYLAARALLDEGDGDFFPTDHRAADVVYLERSKLHIGRREESASRAVTPKAPPDGGVPLPAEPLPAATLIDVLARRVSARGALAGPLTAPQLGTLRTANCRGSANFEKGFGRPLHGNSDTVVGGGRAVVIAHPRGPEPRPESITLERHPSG